MILARDRSAFARSITEAMLYPPQKVVPKIHHECDRTHKELVRCWQDIVDARFSDPS